MSTSDSQVKNLVLGYFEHIHAHIKEKNDVYDIEIPQNKIGLFRRDKLKITFEKNIEKPDSCELISPGSNTLFLIMNECINFGPVLSVKKIKNEENFSQKLRFYFYVIFESIKSKTKIHYVDVDMTSLEVSKLNDSEINFNSNPEIQNISTEKIIQSYIVASDHIEKILKPEINEFKNRILELKNEELQQIKEKYSKLKEQINQEYVKLQSNDNSEHEFYKIIDLNENYSIEETNRIQILDEKYKIKIDFALISILVTS